MTPITEESPHKINASQPIFIDSQIIQFSTDKNKTKSQAYWDVFERLKKQGFELAISEIVIAENLQGLYGKQRDKAYNNLSEFVKKPVSENVLLLAAAIGGLYRDQTDAGISLADKIIASTVFLANGLVLTNNHKHFPPPFFAPVEWIQVRYKTQGRYHITDDICLYKPRYELTIRRIKERHRANS